MRGALSWPFVRLYLLTLFYFSANAILNVIIPLKGEALGASNAEIGMVMGAYLFTTMLLRPWAGQVIGRHGAVRVLRLILAVNGVALVLYPFTGLGGYLAARMLQGVCTAFFSMALQLGIIDALPEQERSQGISMYSLCASMPGIIGPLLALGMWEASDGSAFTWSMLGLALLTGAIGYSATLGGSRAANGSASVMQQREAMQQGEAAQREAQQVPVAGGPAVRSAAASVATGKSPAASVHIRQSCGDGATDERSERTSAASVPAPPATPAAGASAPPAASLRGSFGELVRNPHLFKCSVLMLTASVVFGAATIFIPLYASQVADGSAALFLMLQAAVVVVARFTLRKRIPSDGRWHHGFIMKVMLLLSAAALCVSLAAWGGAVLFYAGALLMGLAQALLYPALTTYLSFVLPKASRNVLMGLFIATADLGVSLGGMMMGPLADLLSYSWMYGLCALAGAVMVGFAYDHKGRLAGAAG
ncbi:staphylopine family metallophore export MFS transporter CntE [Paenibacillus sp. SYP-B4298]|uniref:staphylopine family metallophore export MFS transporter CntE n=1 Tax=Paenibacillus sp. SYP-B4298 TaxID=2996034 RepID=UPI0022DE6E78|nr:MFS transporter [Paenibacillus sp. SYP-B4298]